MQPINVLTSTAAPLDRSNIDTDQIIRSSSSGGSSAPDTVSSLLHCTSEQRNDRQHDGGRSPVNQNGRLENPVRVLEYDYAIEDWDQRQR
jgi:hypothetical protein